MMGFYAPVDGFNGLRALKAKEGNSCDFAKNRI